MYFLKNYWLVDIFCFEILIFFIYQVNSRLNIIKIINYQATPKFNEMIISNF